MDGATPTCAATDESSALRQPLTEKISSVPATHARRAGILQQTMGIADSSLPPTACGESDVSARGHRLSLRRCALSAPVHSGLAALLLSRSRGSPYKDKRRILESADAFLD